MNSKHHLLRNLPKLDPNALRVGASWGGGGGATSAARFLARRTIQREQQPWTCVDSTWREVRMIYGVSGLENHNLRSAKQKQQEDSG